jgi:hypothetical protein
MIEGFVNDRPNTNSAKRFRQFITLISGTSPVPVIVLIAVGLPYPRQIRPLNQGIDVQSFDVQA